MMILNGMQGALLTLYTFSDEIKLLGYQKLTRGTQGNNVK